MTSPWAAALPKIDALIAEHKDDAHSKQVVPGCPSCLFKNASWPKSERDDRPYHERWYDPEKPPIVVDGWQAEGPGIEPLKTSDEERPSWLKPDV